MIATIGSLVQETNQRQRWLLASSLYTVACASSALLFGAFLGGLGNTLRSLTCGASSCTLAQRGSALVVGFLALAYACCDLGFIYLPRPSVMKAVPISWWRRWKPYGAALVYGAALGVGFTTRIWFGAFYVICAWCLLQGDLLSGALLMGVYGFTRAVTIFPASWFVYKQGSNHSRRLGYILDKAEFAQQVVAVILFFFGVEIISFALR
jgi:sulfite exporter TauE/SafE